MGTRRARPSGRWVNGTRRARPSGVVTSPARTVSVATMSRLPRIGVLGVGSLGKEHARIYAESAKAELVGVYDLDPHTAKKIADKCRTRVFATIEEMVE